MDQLRWILAGLGIVVIALIYLWGMRARIREELRRRRRAQQADNEPFLELLDEEQAPTDAGGYGFKKFSSITPDHPLADQVLVDVEITPVERSPSQAASDAIPGAQPEETEEAKETEESAADELPTTEPTEPESVAEDNASSTPPEHIPEHQERYDHPPGPPLVAPETADAGDDRPDPGPFKPSRQEPGLPEPLQMTVLLTVLASAEHAFNGSEILATAQEMGLKFHKSGVLDCCSEESTSNKPVFSIAHLREPGIFDPDTINTLTTPGLLLFMHLPGPLEPLDALDFMLRKTQHLAEALEGSVCDEHHQRMSSQRLGHLQSEIAEFERQLRLHQPRF